MVSHAGRGRGLEVVLLAHAASLLGNVVALVAIPWFVLATTGSAARTGVAAFFAAVPLAIGAFFGGAVADRIGPKRASVLGDLVGALSVAGIPLLHVLGVLEFWHVLVLAFLGSLFDGPSQAARLALVPDLVKARSMPLERANAFYQGTEHIGYVLGAPLAGALIAIAGAPTALWANSGSFLVAAAVVGFGVPSGLRRPTGGRSYAGDLRAGLSFIAREPLVRAFLVIPMVGSFLIGPLTPLLLPIYAREELGGASEFGALMGAYGFGGIVGVVVVAMLADRLPRRRTYVVLWLGYGALGFLFVPLPPLVVALSVLAFVGVAAGALGPVEHTVRQERTPPELRGRVLSTVAAAEAVGVPAGVLVAALLVEAFGLRAAFLFFAVGNAALAAMAALVPAARRLDAPSRR
jgi:MFS family permease